MGINFEKALDGWSKKDIATASENEEYISELINDHRNQISLLSRIGNSYYDSDIFDFVSKSEKIFLKSKGLVNLTACENEEPKEQGVTREYFADEYYLKKSGDSYVLILPPMVSQYKLERRMQEGKAIYFLTLDLIKNYERNVGKLEIFDRACITFYHFVDINLPEISVPDPDNIDIKKVIDALQGSIITSDNLLHINLAHKAYLSPYPHTEIYVKKLENIQQKTRGV